MNNSTSTCCDLSCKMDSISESYPLVLITTNCFDLSCIKIVISGLEISSLTPNFSDIVAFPLNLVALTLNSLLRNSFSQDKNTFSISLDSKPDPTNAGRLELEEEEECLHPWVEVDETIRPLPQKSLNILVGLTLKLDSLCITVSIVENIWTLHLFCDASLERFVLVWISRNVKIL